ncbi:CopD family protein [Candidatus Venteria ishoeyi]|uniref:Copper resistance protein D n=1 Tax=Candidatus Venteria ishoeyi TaxID=1899563 RepID=A0A1H6F8K8_9GAMM|nr:CopD family protein [Candidatus Venteria ishoeyi]MDM8547269.1 CopD family protein [Candidatus Venteria ishoeyi]SEH06457.1 Copper resistance protein D [Candidatus Venteria ishoeyi]
MLFALALLLHLVSVVVWVGGMIFAHQILRPVAVELLEPPLRLTLWINIFRKFFFLVWLAVIFILITGLWMMFAQHGGFQAKISIHIMFTLGLVMTLIYLYVFFSPYQKLKAAVTAKDWPTGAQALAKIRMAVGWNTILGLLTISVAALGRYLF